VTGINGSLPDVPLLTPTQAAEINQLTGTLPAGYVMGADGVTPVYVGAGLPIMTPQEATQVYQETGQYPLAFYSGSYTAGSSIKQRVNSDVLEPLGNMIHLL